MIDYLEQFFFGQPEQQTAPALPDAVKRAETPALDEPEGLAVPDLSRSPEEPVSTNLPARGESFWQQEAIRRVERAITAENGAYPSIQIARPVEKGAGEELEHRLRRRSRRYDGGFYLY